MVTMQRLRILSPLGLGVGLFVAPAWAEIDHRVGFPPLQGRPPVVVHEGQLHGTGSITTHRGGLSPGSHKAGRLNWERVEGRVAGSRTTTSLHSDVHVRRGEIPKHGVGGAGIPVWRW